MKIKTIENAVNFLDYEKEFDELLNSVREGENVDVFELKDYGKLHLLSYLQKKLKKDLLLISDKDSFKRKKILESFVKIYSKNEVSISYMPSLYPSPYKLVHSPLYIKRERFKAFKNILFSKSNILIVDVLNLLFPLPPLLRLEEYFLKLSIGDIIDRDDFILNLQKFGYEERDIVSQPGDFTVRGSIVDVFPITEDYPLRIEFEDDEIFSIRSFSPKSQLSIKKFKNAVISSINEYLFFDEKKELEKKADNIFKKKHIRRFFDRYMYGWKRGEYINGEENLRFFLNEKTETTDLLNLPIIVNLSFQGSIEKQNEIKEKLYDDWEREKDAGVFVDIERINFNEIVEFLRSASLKFVLSGEKSKHKVFTFTYESLRIKNLLKDFSRRDEIYIVFTRNQQLKSKLYELKEAEGNPNIFVIDEEIEEGFRYGRLKVNFVKGKILTGEEKTKSVRGEIFFKKQFEIKPGDYVVHKFYGIGRFLGTKIFEIDGIPNEFLEIEYDGGDKIYLELSSMELLYRYSAQEGYKPKLDRLGTKKWEIRKRRIKEELLEYAKKLIMLYATRKASRKTPYTAEPEFEEEFYSLFEYELTEDQKRSWEEIKKDLESPYPMDRLLCGDVGFGKTEIAIRAAFKAVISGKQVALLSPTTILVEQHYRTFIKRFSQFPVKVEKISRFATTKEKKRILSELKEGKIDIVIGTHSLFSKDVEFKNLGLLIIDEEQRFGVLQKERLLSLKKDIDLLILTATPIPRTLNMALSGVRELSIIETPPPGRLDVETYVEIFNEETLKDAIEFEIRRGGQVYIVFNRIERLSGFRNFLLSLKDEISVAVIHSKMKPKEIEKNMMDFIAGKYNVLLSTTIIENGIDIPNVNTLIVIEAENFGLSQLYQLRGRVGRSTRKAFAYFFISDPSTITDKAKRRLRAIKEFSYLGSGFRLAAEDLEIRGAGNLLGKEQHGHIEALGFEYYLSMLKKAIDEVKGESEEEFHPRIVLPLNFTIDKDYIPQASQRIYIYKRFSDTKSFKDIDDIVKEIEDRFGRPDEAIGNLIFLSKVKILMKELKIERLEYIKENLVFTLSPLFKMDSQKLFSVVRGFKGEFESEWSIKFGVKKTKIKSFVLDFLKRIKNF